MDHLEQLRDKIQNYLIFSLIAANIIVIATYWLLQHYAGIDDNLVLVATFVVSIFLAIFIASRLSHATTAPIKVMRQAILSLNPSEKNVETPDIEKLKVGRELVTNLIAQVSQLANMADKAMAEDQAQIHDVRRNFIAQNLPLPLFILDPSETIIFANESAAQYIGIAAKDMIGKNVYMVLDMSFPNEKTFDSWLKDAKTKSATSTSAWERVRLNVRDDHPARLFDLAAYYNRDNPDHHETMLVLFDHTKQYSQDDQAVSFIALSVHELRTPLTLLRGYIEVFEEELNGKLDPELQSFMQKMRAMSDQLTDFVNNILNVARVDDDQLELRLQSEDWNKTIKSAVEMMSLRAKVRDITIHCRIHLDLPPVGIDRLSIKEVLNNLIDNAIKYSGTSKEIKIETRLNQEGLIETTVQDFGTGIPSNVLPNLFTKFYRDHHNRAQIGGTGLGLYLSKAIIDAHGGQIWVRSQEGQGTTFGFTLLPYDKLADEQKQAGDQGITKSAHGWIKNHSLYRR